MKLFAPIVLLALLPSAFSLYGPLEHAIGLSDNAKLYIMCQHNRIRAQVAKGGDTGYKSQPKAANMQALCWCEELVAKAQEHASNCSGPPHDKRSGRKTANFPDVGQSLMNTLRSSPIDEAMEGFLEECNGYDFENNYCDTAKAGRAHVCGHYTALVWAETQCLGCTYDQCSGKPHGRLVCNYGPGGNIEGKKPYVSGEPCTQCKSGQMCLDNGLCSDKMNCAGDRCSAPPSTDSTSECKDLNPSCPAYRDYPTIRACDADSPYLLFAQQNCKATCGWCGGVNVGKVCAKSINVTSDLCEKLTTIDRRECKVGNGLTYAGTKSQTKNGEACIPWKTNDARTNYYNGFEFPDRNKNDAQNYCRNPASSGTGPWCYTASSWGYCDIPDC
ncbi:hypothetical protein BOX15_Mlig024285g3 [Macrostomum lignano]|uniref:Kringle domain-containing protein n=1 Tax=Macrostomum lignano TaxID=282301 RepID=A0A267G673_9PLAT|nr:hypothetical protein BOX15_Mlig024285g3 [Macrostomum lignano]